MTPPNPMLLFICLPRLIYLSGNSLHSGYFILETLKNKTLEQDR